MGADPLLVLQMHRMGDLILTFPLLMRLRQLFPGHPLWVVAEPNFFQDLMPLAPDAVFFPPEHCPTLAKEKYAAAINLSSSPVAAACMAKLQAPLKLGPVADGTGLHIKGFWQLYRAALTQNNRHNAFHWADMHLLDLAPVPDISSIKRTLPQAAGTRRVGLVLGASEAAKRPDVDFWARLAVRLTRAEVTPVFLGGKAETALGEAVGRRCALPQANLCGRLSLKDLAVVMRTLDLCVTPDTGPMHLADFVGVPVLNLSMGPVHARETGPTSPNQWVLRAPISCVGCWQCQRTRLFCKQAFLPLPVAQTITALLQHSPGSLQSDIEEPAGLALYRTGRDDLGLHTLTRCAAAPAPSCRPLLEDVWQAAFLFLYDPRQEPMLRQRLGQLYAGAPALARFLATRLTRLCAECARLLRQGGTLSADYWRSQPNAIRLFAGHLQMSLQNSGFSAEGWRASLQQLGSLAQLFAENSR